MTSSSPVAIALGRSDESLEPKRTYPAPTATNNVNAMMTRFCFLIIMILNAMGLIGIMGLIELMGLMGLIGITMSHKSHQSYQSHNPHNPHNSYLAEMRSPSFR